MSDFQYTNQEKALMFDHWYRGRLSDDELRAYRAEWHQNRRRGDASDIVRMLARRWASEGEAQLPANWQSADVPF